ncbi:MAG: hypothetical protein C0524_07025 [Rhodobacter sp.]|nr:hypothetical protein [Rhodobacter sp.]
MTATGRTRRNTLVILLVLAVLIPGFVFAPTVPAGEYPPKGWAVFTLALGAVMTLILVVLLVAGRAGLGAIAMLAGPLGVLAGAGQIGIRFASDHAQWTGQFLAPVFG